MPPPNLLFLYTDQQRADTMAAYGNDHVKVPNLNRLAEQSVVFERAYVSQTVCTPSRSTIMTGLYPHTNTCIANNVHLPEHVPCLPELLPEGVYRTAHMGKWHLGCELFGQHGFDEWISTEVYQGGWRPWRDQTAKSTYHYWLAGKGVCKPEDKPWGRGRVVALPDANLLKPAYLAEKACRFMEENNNRPFALYVNFLEPHTPMYHPPGHEVDPDSIPLPDDLKAWPKPDQHLKAQLLERHFRCGPRGASLAFADEAAWRQFISQYWGMCGIVDTYAGKILDRLEKLGLADNTIVIYTSDHGDMLGNHGLVVKTVQFEGAARIPMLVRLPGQTEGRRVSRPVSQVDLLPTILDLCGQNVPDYLQGTSWKPVLEGGDESPLPDEVVVEWNGSDGALRSYVNERNMPDFLSEIATCEEMVDAVNDPVRTVITPDGWKVNFSLRGDHELYNLNDDPGEQVNLIARPEHRTVIHDLWQRLVAWQKRTNDPVTFSYVEARQWEESDGETSGRLLAGADDAE